MKVLRGPGIPFGLRLAPFPFNSVAYMVEWILKISHHMRDLLHYLDDFITAGLPNSPRCAHYLRTAREICNRLSLPLHTLKWWS